MARGRKPLPKNYDKLIYEVEEKIVRYKKRIEEFEKEREGLIEEKKQKELEALYNGILLTGQSVNDFIGYVHKNPNEVKAARQHGNAQK